MTPTDPGAPKVQAAEEPTAKLIRELRERGGILASERHVGQEVFMVKTAAAMGRAASRLEEQERQLAVLTQALEFYATADYRHTYGGEGHVALDRGSKARAALKAREAGLGAGDE